ncbi:zf-HC2 domain-containing protein [Cellulomonas fimi]|uniref:Zf-HC2 domain-containing protein n=1 Tax=Cellulomonas fimi TaxID=1708 RepID=A0A7Y0QG96_CELFI|nr:zf-HC2 domain-containing protein [Cellulomonas fimi]NMR19891.1 zf-HC2 domain-containing protein [Cellulomonas fimi]
MNHHLGSWVSALVDGQLPPAEAERALAHAAACPLCAEEVAAARQARRALSVARDVEPAPDLTARLLALAATADPQDVGRQEVRGRGARVLPLGSSAYAVPARALTGELASRRLPRMRLAAGSLVGVGVVTAGLFLLGEQPRVVPSTDPAEALSQLARAQGPGTGSASVVEVEVEVEVEQTPGTTSPSTGAAFGSAHDEAVLAWLRREGWTGPAALPEGYEVTSARLTHGATGSVGLELDLDGPDGRVVVTEEHGRLDVSGLDGATARTMAGYEVYELSRQPWHVVWQSQDTVVSLVAGAPADSLTDLVAGFPADGYDDRFPARITRGWDTVTGALARP